MAGIWTLGMYLSLGVLPLDSVARPAHRLGPLTRSDQPDSPPLIVRSSAIAASTPVGGKARALAAAERAGLPVPPWFVVLPAAFTHASRSPITSDPS